MFDLDFRSLATAALVATPLLGACDEGTGPDLAPETSLSVYLTDAPGDVDSVWVQIDDIVLKGDDGSLSVLDEPTGLVNLLALRDSAMPLVEGMEMDTATYNEIRFVLGGAVLQTKDGDVYAFGGAEHPYGMAVTGSLVCPSCSQSGIKVKLHEPLTLEEGENGLLLDFDVSQSFGHQAGQSGKWVMHPVIHAEHDEPDDIEDEEAEIEGTVVLAEGVTVPACGGSERTLAALVPTATSTTLTDDEGNPLVFTGEVEADDDGFEFEIDVMPMSTYDLGAAATEYEGASLVWTLTADPAQVTLGEDDEAEGVLLTVTAVQCQVATP